MDENRAALNKALIDRMYAAMNQNKVGVMKDYWTDSMVWRGPAGVGTHHGVEAFEQNVRAPFIRAFPDKNGYDEVRLAEGNFVAGTGYQHTTFAEDWLGIPANGQQVKVRYMDFWRIEGDRIAENWVLIDVLGVLEQAGYNVEKVLKFVGSKPPEFFEETVKDSPK
jgi:predicted ester cyclase